MRFDEALEIAKRTVAQSMNGMEPELIGFQKSGGCEFKFLAGGSTVEVVLDGQGGLIRLNRLDARQPMNVPMQVPTAPAYQVDQGRAVQMALSHVDGGKVLEVDREHGGYEIEIAQGMGRRVKVFVGHDGSVTMHKKSRFHDMMDFDL